MCQEHYYKRVENSMKILIAEDHALFREALKALILSLEPTAKILETSTYQETYKLSKQNVDIDYIVLDLDLPDASWEEGLNEIISIVPQSRVIVISASEDIQTMRKAGESGIVGYIPKSVDTKILSGALHLILAGGSYIPIEVIKGGFVSNNNSHKENKSGLTKRQNEVLLLVAEGKSNKQIAYEMGVSEATVKLHINALLRTLGVTNRTQAVITAQKHGYI